MRASLKGWGRRLAKPQRQSGALTADVLAVIRLTAVQPRKRGRGIETPAQAAERGKFDLALVAVLCDGGLRRSEAAVLTWGATCSAGTTAQAVSPSSAPRPTPSPGHRGGCHPYTEVSSERVFVLCSAYPVPCVRVDDDTLMRFREAAI